MKKSINLSIIVPVYNEEGYIGACLDSIAAQSQAPEEVIVVDNNSSDRTLSIVKKYPFVTLLHEEQQGQGYAQVKGFDLASGDVIGRIDADSILPHDWAENMRAAFQDKKIVAVTGAPEPYDIPFRRLGVAAFQIYHDYLTTWTAGTHLLYGSNCAFRQSLWSKVKSELRLDPSIWEDYDLGFVLSRYGKIAWRPDIKTGCSFRKFRDSFVDQMRYQFKPVRTFSYHVSWWRVGLQALVRFTIVLSLPFELLHKSLIKLRFIRPD